MSSKDWVDEMIVMIMTKLKEKILWLKKSERNTINNKENERQSC